MKKLLIPLILLALGIGGGVGAGLAVAPDPMDELADGHGPCGDLPVEVVVESDPHHDEMVTDETEDREYAKLSNQFVVPIVHDERVSAMVVMSISVEVLSGEKDSVFLAEPKLRDTFLQVMFNHANIGGFSGNFTSAQNMRILRENLLRSARGAIGEKITDVLIVDIVRQDI